MHIYITVPWLYDWKARIFFQFHLFIYSFIYLFLLKERGEGGGNNNKQQQQQNHIC